MDRGVHWPLTYDVDSIFLFYLFVINGHRPLTYHVSSITEKYKNAQAIKMNKLIMQVTKPHRTSISCK